MFRKGRKNDTRKRSKESLSHIVCEVGSYKRDKESDSTLKKTGESSVQSIAEEEEDIDGLAASVDHDTTESRESTTDSSLSQDTVHSGSPSFDVGTLTGFPTIKELEKVVRTGHLPHPPEFPKDYDGHKFPTTVLNVKQQNGEVVRRSWLVFSPTKAALYCLPCRLFCPHY